MKKGIKRTTTILNKKQNKRYIDKSTIKLLNAKSCGQSRIVSLEQTISSDELLSMLHSASPLESLQTNLCKFKTEANSSTKYQNSLEGLNPVTEELYYRLKMYDFIIKLLGAEKITQLDSITIDSLLKVFGKEELLHRCFEGYEDEFEAIIERLRKWETYRK